MEAFLSQTEISLETIAAAERIMGVVYSAQERLQMLDNLEGQITSALQRRVVPLANSVPMAMRFDPRLPGFAMPHETDLLHLSVVTAPLPDQEEDIAFAPVINLAAWIKSGKLTSRRLTQIYLDRSLQLALSWSVLHPSRLTWRWLRPMPRMS